MTISAKDPAETITVTFDFTSVADEITSASVIASVAQGRKDNSPQDIVSNTSITGPLVMQRIIGGQEGTTYHLRCLAYDADGEVYVLTTALPVLTSVPT